MENKLVESKYNLIVDMGNKMMVYNTKKGSVLKVNEDDYLMVKDILQNPDNHTSNSNIDMFINNGFIVNKDIDELQEIKEVHELYKKDNKSIFITMLPAEYCNFRCPYCFIHTYRDKHMQKDIYSRVYKFIENTLKENIGEQTYLYLSWFGGEPLLAYENIVNFTKEVQSLNEKYKVKLYCGITTNGYKLDYKSFNTLVESGVTNYQVTFDGDKENHDSLRFLSDGTGTFDTILNNIRDIKLNCNDNDKFSFDIRINFLRTSVDSVYRLIDKVADIIKGDNRFTIYCRPVFDFETSRDTINDLKSDICRVDEGIKTQTEFAFYIEDKLNRKSKDRMFNPLPQPTPIWCSIERKNSFIVGADGKLFLCDSNINDDLSIGKINEDGSITYNEKVTEWKKPIFEFESANKCVECKLLPICMGGCKRCRINDNLNPCFWSEEQLKDSMKKYLLK